MLQTQWAGLLHGNWQLHATLIDRLVAHCVLRHPVYRISLVHSASSATLTWQDLENVGLIYLLRGGLLSPATMATISSLNSPETFCPSL
jgi:hypothetical protein